MYLFSTAYLETLLRLVVATLLGGIIGFERAGKKHDAGLRTHILVCLGSATVMIMSEIIVTQYAGSKLDITRMGAQVISGIGFLGAGCIITDGNKAKGLTTAAGLWATACVGLVIGMGYYTIAVTVVALMLFAMLGLRPLALKLYSKSLDITISFLLSNHSEIEKLLRCMKDMEIEVVSVKIDEHSNSPMLLILDAHVNGNFKQDVFLSKISLLDGIKEIAFT